MSEQPEAPGPAEHGTGEAAGAAPAADVPPKDAPLDERPAVAGGNDDGPPAQGEGVQDSW